MLGYTHFSRFRYFQDHKCKLSEHKTHIYLLSRLFSLLATYIWSSLISPHKSWPCMSQCFSSLTGHKGELNMSMHANLISSLCNQLKVVFNIEETVFFLLSTNWISTDMKHFCFWQIRGRTKEEGAKLRERQLKEKVGKQKLGKRKRCCWVPERKTVEVQGVIEQEKKQEM